MSGLERAPASSRGNAGRRDNDGVTRTELGGARHRAGQPHRQFQPQWRKTIRGTVRASRGAAVAVPARASTLFANKHSSRVQAPCLINALVQPYVDLA